MTGTVGGFASGKYPPLSVSYTFYVLSTVGNRLCRCASISHLHFLYGVHRRRICLRQIPSFISLLHLLNDGHRRRICLWQIPSFIKHLHSFFYIGKGFTSGKSFVCIRMVATPTKHAQKNRKTPTELPLSRQFTQAAAAISTPQNS